ncbi:MAG: response regulator [Gemmatimonadaceae bacterium]
MISDSIREAELVKDLLADEFDGVHLSTTDESTASEVQRLRPLLLVFSFRDLRAAEQSAVRLYASGLNDELQKLRSIVLCARADVRLAYSMCRKGRFDDYVLFWPMSDDVPRMKMAIHRALADASVPMESGPSAAELAAQARRLEDLETQLRRQLSRGEGVIGSTAEAVSVAEQELRATLGRLRSRATEGGTAALTSDGEPSPSHLSGELRQLDATLEHLTSADRAVRPLSQWIVEFHESIAPQLDALRELGRLADEVSCVILIVDDDEFQRELLGQMLQSAGYLLAFAASGLEALKTMRTVRPDLILLDYMMPDASGVEVTRHLRSVSRFATTPVIMITGISDREVVLRSMEVGVADFIVKPVDREILLAKVRRALAGYSSRHT